MNNNLLFKGDRNAFGDLLQHNPGLIFVKFTATWCGPCKKIKPLVDQYFSSMPENILCIEIDIDESIDVYAFMKKKKMVPGVPTILCYHFENTDIYPDEMISGADENQVKMFFKTCINLLN